MRAPRLFPLLLVAFSFAIAGCGESFEASGGGGGSGGSGGGGSGGDTTEPAGGQGGGTTTGEGGAGGGPLCVVDAPDACAQCLVNHCEVDVCACVASSACINYGICIQMAGPEPQFANFEYCWQQNKGGISLAGSLHACGSKHCGECGYPPVSECAGCEYKKCGQQINDCLGNYKCTGYIACLDACPDNDLECLTACGTQHATGQQLFQAIRLCSKAECAELCP